MRWCSGETDLVGLRTGVESDSGADRRPLVATQGEDRPWWARVGPAARAHRRPLVAAAGRTDGAGAEADQGLNQAGPSGRSWGGRGSGQRSEEKWADLG